MKDLRKLIRKVLKEQTNQSDFDLDIMDYKGDDKEINRMKQSIYYGKNLSEKDIKYAHEFFKKEKKLTVDDDKFSKPEEDISEPVLSRDEYLKKFKEELKLNINKIKSEGVITYLDLVRSGKRHLFKNEKIKVAKPSESWYKENIKDLEIFRDRLKPFSNNKFKFGNDLRTIDGQINFLMERLVERDIYGFLEKSGKEYVWSILNKTDTNYTNWINLIYDAEVKDRFPENLKTTLSKINYYFKQNVIKFDDYGEGNRDFIRNWVKDNKVTEFSMADADLVGAFNNYSQEDENRAKNIYSTLMNSTAAGDEAEKQFIKFLTEEQEVPESHIKSFSSHGNIVDITFQTDLIVLNVQEERWEPIQVKSKKLSTGLLRFGIPGAKLVYPSKGGWKREQISGY
jgi:hypothetical protein